MKGLSYSFLRAICALVIGLVLVMFPDQAGDYFVITIGVIFLVPSLISIIGYFAQSTEMRSRFPIEGVLDGGTGRFLCGSGIDSACRLGCAVQSYGSTLHGIYHYRYQQSGLCGFGTAELVQVYASPPEDTGCFSKGSGRY